MARPEDIGESQGRQRSTLPGRKNHELRNDRDHDRRRAARRLADWPRHEERRLRLVTGIARGVVGGVMGGFVLRMQGIPAAGSRFAMVAAALVGAFILIVVQRKFWGVKMAPTA
jgi:uncharacterized membrane protein YeaQ/YmgE (transglycosylase-associated protein family)